ncbi:MAG: preprotein translocase subunit SecY [Alphaproteobacteria bacterium]|nr:preprotein translocase subunit SecY [Alphaproteobacteria bacterium]
MASAAEQLVQNLNFGAFAKAKELQQRILFTLFALIVYRIGTYIPLPGIDPETVAQIFGKFSGGIGGMINMFTGGAIQRMAIFALNIMPYISASIIMQLMTTVSPKLEAIKKEGEAGRKQINQYTRYLTVVLAGFQAFAIAIGLQNATPSPVMNPGPLFLVSTTVTLTGGTIFLMWLGEQITARGIGNGISLIIFAGIIAGLPGTLLKALELGRTTDAGFTVLILFLVGIAVITIVVFFERAQRRLLVQYPKRQVGNRMFGGETSHLPLKVNSSGVIPPIFASSLLLMPLTAATFTQGTGEGPFARVLSTITAYMQHGSPLFMLSYAALIIFFAFFYTAIVFNPQDTAENLKKYGGFIAGIRPGKRTADYIDYVLTRLTVVGSLYLTFVCLVPEFLNAQYAGLPYIGGTSLMIAVTVTMDTLAQLQGHLLAHQYEGLIKKAKLRGSRK